MLGPLAAEIRLDHRRVTLHLRRRALGDLAPEVEDVDAVGEDLLGGPLAARMASDLDVLEHRHAREELDVLERPRDAPADDPVGRRSQQALAGEGDLARIRAVQAGDQVEERRLAGAVRADQPGNLALLDRERDVVDGDDASEPLREVLDREQSHGGRTLESLSRWGLVAGA